MKKPEWLLLVTWRNMCNVQVSGAEQGKHFTDSRSTHMFVFIILLLLSGIKHEQHVFVCVTSVFTKCFQFATDNMVSP